MEANPEEDEAPDPEPLRPSHPDINVPKSMPLVESRADDDLLYVIMTVVQILRCWGPDVRLPLTAAPPAMRFTMLLPLPSSFGAERSTPAHWHVALLAGGLLIACGEGDSDDTGGAGNTLESGFEADLSDEGGCADVVVYASDADDELALHFSSDEGLTEQAHAAGAVVTRTWDLASELPTELTVTVGTNLTHATCSDYIEYARVIDGTWIPVAGTLTLEVTPRTTSTGGGSLPADAVLTFEDVEWISSDDESASSIMMSSLSLQAHVGWWAG